MRDKEEGPGGRRCRYCKAKYSDSVFQTWRSLDELLDGKLKLRYDVLPSTTSPTRAGKIAADALRRIREGEVLMYPIPRRMTPADRMTISRLNGEGSVLLELQENVVLVFLRGSNDRVTMYQVERVNLDLPPVTAKELLTEPTECELCSNNANCFHKCAQCDHQICETCNTNIHVRAKYLNRALGGKCPYCRYDALQHLEKALITV